VSKREKLISILAVAGCEGPSLYINDYRICGNKPWGGGRTIHEWKISRENLEKGLLEALGKRP
jgi:hypothetical protein